MKRSKFYVLILILVIILSVLCYLIVKDDNFKEEKPKEIKESKKRKS